MFRNHRRLIALGERAKALKMMSVERLRTTDRHGNAVQGEGIVAADLFKRMMRRAAGPHVGFGMNPQEAVPRPLGQNRRPMRVLEACTRKTCHRVPGRTEAPLWVCI